ncbi:cytochrome P450 2C16-like [Gastrophryne carolinensis]
MIEFQDVTACLVGFITLIIFLSYGKLLWRRRKLPPGPFPLPFLGNFLKIHSDGLLPALVKMSKVYGPVYTVHFGSKPAVIVTGYETLKEVLVDDRDVFINRGTLPALDNILHLDGLTFMNGEIWKQLRQFSLWTLRDFGMGKKSIEEQIHEELHHFVEHFKNLNGKPVNPKSILDCATSNILAKILMGNRYDYNDKNWINVLQLSNKGFHILSSIWGQLCDMFPRVMDYLPGPHKKMLRLLMPLKNIFIESVKTHLEALDPACPRDFMDCYLIKMKQEEKSNTKTPFTIKNLAMTTYDMFLGGTESTAGTTYFGLLFLIKHPELQEKLHEEIDQVIGQSREPKSEDRSHMPLMNAFVHEIQRFSDIFPMGVMRATTRDTKLRGFFIPKNTNVLPMLTTALHDATMFETPEKFNVKHFLDENGKFRKNNAFLPFSAGKRVCIAEGLVRMQIFLFFTIILQKFTLKSEVDPKDLDIAPVESGIENVPPTCNIIFTPRSLERGA